MFTGLVMHLHHVCIHLLVSASVCMSVSARACVCVYMHVCEGGFISSCRWPQPLIHRSSKMKSPLKSEGREERNGQTRRQAETETETEREREGAQTKGVSERE